MINKAKLDAINWWHSIHIPGYGYTNGKVNHGPNGADWPSTRFGLPGTLVGQAVLDIGAWDGFFSFEAEKRGAASILAVDCDTPEGGNLFGPAGFRAAKEALRSNVDRAVYNVEKSDNLGLFDLVLCYGVLYHLKSPLTAMYNLSKHTAPKGMCLIETAISKNSTIPNLEYRPGFDNDPTNYFYPNTQWIEQAALQVGFKSTEIVYNDGIRATFRLQK